MSAMGLRILLQGTDAEDGRQLDTALLAVLTLFEEQEHELLDLRRRVEELERRLDPDDDGFRFG